MDLGKIERLSARQAWPHEAADFTPWLLANASELGEAIGMDLEFSEAEHSVGAFWLDLIGSDLATGEKVIVENQLDKSDHGHLGQLLTYAAGTDAAAIIWITEEFRSEHRAALDWLNERTTEHTRFFGVQVSTVRIDNSRLAPFFEIIVAPNDWQKEVRTQAAINSLSSIQEMYREFWSMFLPMVHQQHPGWTNAKKALPQQWMNLPSGVGSVNYAVVAAKQFLRVEIYFSSSSSDVNEENFNRVMEHKERLEEAFGHPLNWEPLPGRKACRISFSRSATIANQDDWPEYSQWLVHTAGQLRNAVQALGGMQKILTTS